MTVLENVLVGAHTRMQLGRREATVRASALEKLDYLGLADFANRPAAGLPVAAHAEDPSVLQARRKWPSRASLPRLRAWPPWAATKG